MFKKKMSSLLVGVLASAAAMADYQAGFAAYDAGDYTTALAELMPEAENGDPWAQFIIGRMYANGYGVAEDSKQALHWYEKAAGQGHDLAQFNLADMYDFGQGVPEDNTKAAYWYKKLAMQGISAAQYRLGLLYVKGEGVPEDIVRGYAWVNLAAKQGNEKAQGSEEFSTDILTTEQIAEGKKLSNELFGQINGAP